MKDMARYLGALKYANGSSAPTEIYYDGDTYTWNPTSADPNGVALLGSNWYDAVNDQTLVGAITADILLIANEGNNIPAAITALNDGLSLKVDGQDLILKSKANQ